MGKVLPFREGSEPALLNRPDDELMLLARGGRAVAFGVLIERHQLRALNLAHKLLGDRSDAKDACQDAFVEIFRYLPRYQAQGRFLAFLSRFVVIQCRLRWRKTVANRKAIRGLEQIPRPRPDLADEEILRQQREEQLQRAIGGLSEIHREVLVLRFADDLSYQEIAGVLDIPLGTVRSRLSLALNKVREIIGGASQ